MPNRPGALQSVQGIELALREALMSATHWAAGNNQTGVHAVIRDALQELLERRERDELEQAGLRFLASAMLLDRGPRGCFDDLSRATVVGDTDSYDAWTKACAEYHARRHEVKPTEVDYAVVEAVARTIGFEFYNEAERERAAAAARDARKGKKA